MTLSAKRDGIITSLLLFVTIFQSCLHQVACLPPSVPGFPHGAIVTDDYTTGGCINVYRQWWRVTPEGRAGNHVPVVSRNFLDHNTNPASGQFDCEDQRELDWDHENDHENIKLYSYYRIECGEDEELIAMPGGNSAGCLEPEEEEPLFPGVADCVDAEVENEHDNVVVSWVDKVTRQADVQSSLYLWGSSTSDNNRWSSEPFDDVGTRIVRNARSKQVYRACAKIPPGHGNGKIHIALARSGFAL